MTQELKPCAVCVSRDGCRIHGECLQRAQPKASNRRSPKPSAGDAEALILELAHAVGPYRTESGIVRCKACGFAWDVGAPAHHAADCLHVRARRLAAENAALRAATGDAPKDDFGQPIVYDTEAVDAVTLALTGDEGEDDSVTVLERMASYVENVWPGKTALQVLLEYEESALRAARVNIDPNNPPRHKFWGAGEPDCPADLKAPNGELHTMRCKVCGDGWRKSRDVCFGAASAPNPAPGYCKHCKQYTIEEPLAASAPERTGPSAPPMVVNALEVLEATGLHQGEVIEVTEMLRRMGEAHLFAVRLDATTIIGSAPAVPQDAMAMLRRAEKALADLSFECFGGIGTRAPSVEAYNRTFGELEALRALLAAQPKESNDGAQ